MIDQPIVKNAVSCRICGAAADRYSWGYQCQVNPNHCGDSIVGIFTDMSYEKEGVMPMPDSIFLQTYGKKVWDELNSAKTSVLFEKLKSTGDMGWKKPRKILFCPVCGDDVIKNGAIGGYASGKPTLWCVCGARLCKGEDNSDVMVRVK